MPEVARSRAALVRPMIVYVLPLVLLLGLWQLAAQLGLVRELFLPSVATVLREMVVLGAAGEILGPLATSLFRAFAGLALAVAAGVAIGMVMARSRWAGLALDPLISVGFPAPKIAFVPIFILWFGIDHLSKILLVAFTCVFPMIVATQHGAATVSRVILWSAKAMGTSERRMLTRIILPAALPHIFSGIRVTVPVALITAFTTEMVAGGGGVGGALMFAQRFFQTPAVFAYILVMLLTGFILDHLLIATQHALLPWQAETDFGQS